MIKGEKMLADLAQLHDVHPIRARILSATSTGAYMLTMKPELIVLLTAISFGRDDPVLIKYAAVGDRT